MSKKFIAYINKIEDVALAPAIIEPAWDGIEDYMTGVFYEGEIPEPEIQDGYNFVRWVNLKDPEKPLIYYTYESLPEPEETQVQRLQKQVDMLTAKTAALASGQEMQEDVITEIVMHVYE